MHRLLITLLLVVLANVAVCFPQQDSDAMDTLDLYWYTSAPFIYENAQGTMEGIEPDLLRAFQEFMETEKGIKVHLDWKKTNNFSEILEFIRKSDNPNAVGISALSITEDRKEYASFTTSYLPDITVLISSKGSEILRSYEEVQKMMESMVAVTIRGTNNERLLKNLQQQVGISFDIEYIDDDINIIDGIRQADNRFGYVDLPVYLLQAKERSDVVRQNFFTVKGQGYAFLMPQRNSWQMYFDEFLNASAYSEVRSQIIANYLGKELYTFLDEIYSGEELGSSLLTKEKEMQLALIRNANLRLEEEQATRRLLMIGIGVIFLFLAAVGFMFYKNQRSTNIILGHKSQIEEQQEDIRSKNEQLMNRNAQLVALNEEKNNLVRILAHDIRSPLSQIMMVIDIVNQNTSRSLTEAEAKMFGQVSASAERINKMVTKILDVDGLEDNRVKVMNERVDIRTIMQDITQRYRPIAAKKNIELSAEFCENHYMIRTDHLLLLLVLENLVSNAVKFSEPGTSVELRAKCAYDNVLFSVSDEGPGFSEEDKKKLFSRFQKLSAKPTGGEVSTGLGLSIVKKYVVDLGGKVWVESEPGKGSTFFVKFTA